MNYRFNLFLTTLFFLTLILSIPPAFSAEDDVVQSEFTLRLEGVVMGTTAREGGIAVIDSETYVIGDVIENYIINEVHSAYVLLEDVVTGKEKKLFVQGSPSTAELRTLNVDDNIDVQEMTDKERMKLKLMAQSSRVSLFANAYEKEILAQLRRVHVAAYDMKNTMGAFPADVNDLVKKRFLPKNFAGGRQGHYQFKIDKHWNGVEVVAQSIFPEIPLKKYYIGTDHKIRFEMNQKPTDKSQLVTFLKMLCLIQRPSFSPTAELSLQRNEPIYPLTEKLLGWIESENSFAHLIKKEGGMKYFSPSKAEWFLFCEELYGQYALSVPQRRSFQKLQSQWDNLEGSEQMTIIVADL